MTEKKENIIIHKEEDFAKMRKAGKLAAETLDYITPFVKAGVTTEYLDELIHDFTIKNNAIPAPLGYRGYPKSCCISVNHVICHGIPDKKVLHDGDIVNIDVTSIVDGWYGDTSRMYLIGNVGIKGKKLVQVTYDAMMFGIEMVKPGNTLGDIGAVIQEYVESHRYSVVTDFCGHGLGQDFHLPPNVLHYGRKGSGTVLEEGMFFTIEPMVNIGHSESKILENGWTAVTRDRSLSAQFEHSIGVTKDGCEIFTLSPKGLDRPPYKV